MCVGYIKNDRLLVSTALRLQADEMLRRGSSAAQRLSAATKFPKTPSPANLAHHTLKGPPCCHDYRSYAQPNIIKLRNYFYLEACRNYS